MKAPGSAKITSENAATYIEERTIPEPNSGCVLWTKGGDKDGYGKLMFNGKHRRAHTVVFELAFGPIPKGHLIQHACDTPACCKLSHLSLGTPLSNMRDKVTKGRLRNQNMDKTHCKNGHEFTPENTFNYGKRVCKTCCYARRKIYRNGPESTR
jgi:hypothetical protein